MELLFLFFIGFMSFLLGLLAAASLYYPQIRHLTERVTSYEAALKSGRLVWMSRGVDVTA